VTPTVLHRHSFASVPANAVYVGRPSKYGNPYVIGRDGTRDEVCDAYEQWATANFTLDEIQQDLRGKHLLCFCAPQRCHADFLLWVANL
jgi:hypothetical protein